MPEQLRSILSISKVLTVFLVLGILSMAFATFTSLYCYVTYAALPPEALNDETVRLCDILDLLAIVGWIFICLVSFVIFMVWVYRTNKNLGLLSGKEMEFTPGWAVGWFFVPFACVYKPYQVMREIWHTSRKESDSDSGYSMVGWWWAIWMIALIAGQAVSRIDDTQILNLAMAASNVLDIAEYIIRLFMIRAITRACISSYSSQNEQNAQSAPNEQWTFDGAIPAPSARDYFQTPRQ